MDRLSGIVDELEQRLGPRDGEPVPLQGGMTNRNYRLGLGGSEYLVRLCGKDTGALGIDRGAECLAAERASELGIGPPVAARLADRDVLVTAFVTGRTADPAALREPAVLARVAAALRAFHGGPPMEVAFDVPTIVEEQREIVLGRGGAVPSELDEALAVARRIAAALVGPEHEPVPCHNDLLSGNFILDGDALHLVDWEYAGMNDRYFDLGNFAVNNELGDDDVRRLLLAYFDADPAEAQLAALALYRYVSDLREAMWGVVQTLLSDLDVDYRAYAAQHFARLHATVADPRFEEWMAVAAAS